MEDKFVCIGASNSFHPKAYIFYGAESDCIYVGSSNVSKVALTDGVEWNYKIEKANDQEAFGEFISRFEYLFNNESIELTVLHTNHSKRDARILHMWLCVWRCRLFGGIAS